MSDTAFRIDRGYSSTNLGDESGIPQPDPRSAIPDATAGEIIQWDDVLARAGRRARKFPLWAVSVAGRPLEVMVAKEGAIWIADNEDYNIHAHGESIAEALDEAMNAVRYLYDELVFEEDDALSDYAKVLKERYLRLTIPADA